MKRLPFVGLIILLVGCNFGGKSQNSDNTPTVYKHSHYTCGITFTRDQREPNYIFYTLNCRPEKKAVLENVRVYTRRLNRKSRRKTTVQMETHLPKGIELAPQQVYKVSGRLDATVRSTYLVELIATGEWRWPEESVPEAQNERTRIEQDKVVDRTKYTFGLIKSVQ